LAIQDFYVMRQPVTDTVLRDPMLEGIRQIRAAGGTYQEVLDARRAYRWAGAGPPRLYYTGYNCADGAVVLGCLTKNTRAGARRVLGMTQDETDDEGFDPTLPESVAKVSRWKEEVAAKFREHPMAYWLERFAEAGVPIAPLQ